MLLGTGLEGFKETLTKPLPQAVKADRKIVTNFEGLFNFLKKCHRFAGLGVYVFGGREGNHTS